MSKTITPSMVRDFLNYVIKYSDHYVFNIKYRNHVAIDYKDFYAYLVYEVGIDVSISEAVLMFWMYACNYLDEFRQRGVISNYWVEKTSKSGRIKVHIILNAEANPVPTVDATVVNTAGNTEP